MKPIKKAMWFELVGGIFGWVWIAASIGAIYFLVQAVFYDGSWVNLVGVMLTGGISKVVLRECEARKNLLMTQESINSDGNTKSDDTDEPAWAEQVEKIDAIKAALITALQNTVDSHQKGALQVAYLSLANWQSDVGDSHQGIDLTKIDPMLDPSEFLAMHESSKDWGQIAQNEEKKLQAELKDLGL